MVRIHQHNKVKIKLVVWDDNAIYVTQLAAYQHAQVSESQVGGVQQIESNIRSDFQIRRLPLVSSTLITTTHSFLPILTSLLIERIRRLDSSLNIIMPSILLYSKRVT